MIKKFGVILTLILGSLLGLVACGDPYKNMSLTLSSYEANLEEEITLTISKDEQGNYTSNEITITGTVEGAGKGVSEELIFPEETLNNKYVGIKDIKVDGNKTSFKIYGKERGKATLEFKAEGTARQTIVVNVEIGIESLNFKQQAIPAIAEGDSFDLNVNVRSLIDFYPYETSQDKVVYTLENVNGLDPNACAKIENNVLYTVKGAVYPQQEGVKVIKVRATSVYNAALTDVIDINVISLTDKVSVTSNNDLGNSINLTTNSYGEYELIMAPLLSVTAQTPYLQYFMSNREICIQVGDSAEEHAKYKVTCEMQENEYLTVTNIKNVSSGGNFNPNFANYQFVAKKVSNTPVIVKFTIEYFGDSVDNPLADENKYKGLFSKTITISVNITSMPSEDTISINNSYEDNITLDVYDYYYGVDGTYLKIHEKFTSINMTYNVAYVPNGYEGGISSDTLSIYTNGKFVDENYNFTNGDVLYLKHHYTSIFEERNPYLEITFSFSFKPSSAPETDYGNIIITKIINLNFLQGIRDVELSNVSLEVTSNESVVLTTFPSYVEAKDSVLAITSSNDALFEVEYEDNKVLVKANKNMLTGTATGVQLITTNGVVSNLATITVYLNTLYDFNSKLYMQVSGPNDQLYYVGTVPEGSERTDFNGEMQQTYVQKDFNTYEYNWFDTLALRTNSEIDLNVYHLLVNNNGLQKVYRNLNVVVNGTSDNIITWNKTTGKLNTYSAITGDEPFELVFNLTATVKNGDSVSNIIVSHTVFVYVYQPLSEVVLKSAYKQVYVQETIGLQQQLENLDKFDIEFVTYSNANVVEFENRAQFFGKVSKQINFNKNILDKVLLSHNSWDFTVSELIKHANILDENGKYEIDRYTFNIYENPILKNILDSQQNMLSEYDLLLQMLGEEGLTIEGSAIYSQFGRQTVVPFMVDVKLAKKVENIITNIDTTKGIAFEYKNGQMSASQSISYVVAPEDATYKDFNIVVTKIADDNSETILHATVNGKCTVCNCDFKDVTYNGANICHSGQDGKHIGSDNCSGNGINITVSNGKITFNITNPELVGKLHIYLVPVDSYKPTYAINDQSEYYDQQIIGYGYTAVVDFIIYVNDGSEKAKFQIRTESDFMTMLNDIRNGSNNATYNGFNSFHYVQVNNINLYGYELFNRVVHIDGVNNFVFKGSYTGSFVNSLSNVVYNSIYGVKLNGELTNKSSLGLFGKLEGSLINVNVESVFVDAKISTTQQVNVGILAGETLSTSNIVSCRVVSDSFKVSNTSQSTVLVIAGGMVGLSNGYISGKRFAISGSVNNSNINSTVAIKLDLKGNDTVNVGGIVGSQIGQNQINEYLFDLSASVNISQQNVTVLNGGIGGIAGNIKNASINNVSVVPAIMGYSNVGGIVGQGLNTSILNSSIIMTYNSNLKNYIKGYNNIGGFAGSLQNSSIVYSYFQSLTSYEISASHNNQAYCGNITLLNGVNNANVGGLVGYASGLNVESVMFKGDVVSYNNTTNNVSGLANVDGENVELKYFAVLGNIVVAEGKLYNLLLTSNKTAGIEEYQNAQLTEGYVYVNNLFSVVESDTKLPYSEFVEENKVFNFTYTNGQAANAFSPVKDSLDNIMYTYEKDENDNYVYTQTARWVISNALNNGFPVLIKLNTTDKDNIKFNALFSSIAKIDAVVLEFVNYGTEEYFNNQGHIKIDDQNVVLFYNQQSDGTILYTDNQYTIVISNEKNAQTATSDVINLNFSALKLNGTIIDVNSLKDCKLTSSSNIVTIDDYTSIDEEVRIMLKTTGTGSAKLTFENIYDESNVVEINIEVIKGIKDFVVSDLNDKKLTSLTYDAENNFADSPETDNNKTLHTYVDYTNVYTAKFVNEINGVVYNAYNLGGYSITFTKPVLSDESLENNCKFKVNGTTVLIENLSQNPLTIDIDKTSNITLFGLQSGYVVATLTPYIYYNGNKVYLNQLSKTHYIFVVDKAQSVAFTSSHSDTIKPEGSVEDLVVEFVTSDVKENLNLTIINNGQVIYNNVLNNINNEQEKTHLLLLNYEKISEEQIIENNKVLYKITYHISLKMDRVAYHNNLRNNRYENPLKQNAVFEIVLTSSSNQLATDKYVLTITPNSLQKINASLYPNFDNNNLKINTTQTVTNKLAPNQYALLEISAIREFNNVSYVEITTNGGRNVSLKQVMLNQTLPNGITYKNLDNSAIIINNGIRLWNVSLFENGQTQFNSKYYVVLGVDDSVVQGSTIEVYINAFDYQGNLILTQDEEASTAKYVIEIENLPSVKVRADGLTNIVMPINSYKQLDIISEHVDDELEYYFTIKDNSVTYDINGNQITSGELNSNEIYLCTYNNGEYKKVENNKLSLNQVYYIYVGPDQYFTDIQLVVTGKKLINGSYIKVDGVLTINTVLATIEGVEVDNTPSNNTMYLRTSTFTSLSASVVLNTEAMEVVNKFYADINLDENGSVNKINYYNSITHEDLTADLSNYEKSIASYYTLINKQISGTDYVKNLILSDNGIKFNLPQQLEKLNNWKVFNADINAYQNLVVNTSYKNFRFFEYTSDDSMYYGIEAGVMGTSQLQIDFKYFYDEFGIAQLVIENNYNSDSFVQNVYKDFTLSILDNTSADHPMPIYTQQQLTQVNVDTNNVDEYGNVIRPHYILMSDIVLENWKPIDFTASSLDGNSYRIIIKSFDLSEYAEASTVSTGLFKTISSYSVLKNLTIDISNLLISSEQALADIAANSDINKNSYTSIDLRGKTSVEFGLLTPVNSGSITNVKVVALEDTSDKNTLLINTTQGYYLSNLCSAYISPFVVNNTGSISYSFVGMAKNVDNTNSKITLANTDQILEEFETYGFNVFGGNKIAGFVTTNSNLISNSYVNGVSIRNLTNINKDSILGGFVGVNNGKIYSSFISASDINEFRAAEHSNYVEGKGNIGAFVYNNQNNGIIENAYAVVNIINRSVETSGFAYTNLGTIKNAYTTSVAKIDGATISEAHGWFIGDKTQYGKLENCYYYLKDGEIGLSFDDAEYYDDNVLKSIDPATPIVDKNNSFVGNVFASKDSFDGFVFVSNSTDLNGIWYINEKQNSAPMLINCVGQNTISYRTISSITNSNGEEINPDGYSETDLQYNYIYKTYNIGSVVNPIVINTAEEFISNIISNSRSILFENGQRLNIFGYKSSVEQSDSVYEPRYVRLINNLDFTNVILNSEYAILGDNQKVKISDIVFNGVIIGNGMSLNGIKLNNTSEVIVEDYGLFKQVGLSNEQLALKISGKNTVISQDNPFIFNLSINYEQVKYKNARKVGVLAGSIYNSTLLMININGTAEAVNEVNSFILGYNLVGGLAGYIAGDNTKISYVNLTNIKVDANNNPTANITNEYEDLYGYYNTYALNGDYNSIVKSVKVEYENTKINNLDKLSYGGAVAGLININNTVNVAQKDKYNYEEYHSENSNRNLANITVSENLDIRADQSGGLFGGMINTSLYGSKLQIIEAENSVLSYQTIFGYNYAGGIVGEMINSTLDQVNVVHSEEQQLDIDNNISKLNSISKTDLFKISDPNALNVSIAIGGLAGYSENSAIVFSASKVNVSNQSAKIAGGLVGYAKDYNYMAYSYTTGNVFAKDVIGGLVGFYSSNGFDYYLFNSFGLNVWSLDIKDLLLVNSKAIYNNIDTKSIRMPEIGNQTAQNQADEYYLKTNDLSQVAFDEPKVFTYIGSVMGKFALSAGVYDFAEIKNTGEVLYNNEVNTSVKNLFVHADNNKLLFNNGKIISVSLFAKDQPENSILLNRVVTRTDANDNKYYTYYNNYFFNVFSTTYSTISTSGSLENDNYVTHISSNSFDLMNKPATLPVDGNNLTNADTNIVKYNNIIGNQYYVSYITGDYYVSQASNANYAQYVNEFANINTGFITLPVQQNFEIALKEAIENYTQLSLIYSVDITNSSVWYVVNNCKLPTYTVGKTLSFNSISPDSKQVKTSYTDLEIDELFEAKNTNNDLNRFFSTSNKGKTLALEYGQYYILLDGNNLQKYSLSFQGNISGMQSDEGENPVITLMVDNSLTSKTVSLFDNINNAQFTNVDFQIVFKGNKNLGTSSSGYYGVIARELNQSEFINTNFSFIFKSNNPSIKFEFEETVKTAGFVFGLSYLSKITDSTISFSNSITLQGYANTFGLFIGEVSNRSKLTNIKNALFVNKYIGYESFATENINIGGLFGSVYGNSTINNLKIVENANSLTLNVYSISADLTTANIGGIVGLSNASNLSNFDLNLGNAHTLDKIKTLNIGGTVGYATNTILTNVVVGGQYVDNYTLKLSTEEYISVYIAPSTLVQTVNFGGIVGKSVNSSILGEGQFIYANNKSNKVSINNNNMELIIGDSPNLTANVGGLIGLQENSNNVDNAINYAINIKDIVVELEQNTNSHIKTLAIGGLIGSLKNASINNSYSMGDLRVYDSSNKCVADTIYAGGVVGLATLAGTINQAEISDVNTYGDIVYGAINKKAYYGGVIGYNAGTAYGIDYVNVFTNIYSIVNLQDYKMSNDIINPFAYFATSTEGNITDSMFINEHYLSQANSEIKYSNLGVWLSDILEEFDVSQEYLYCYDTVFTGAISDKQLSINSALLSKTYQLSDMPNLVVFDENQQLVMSEFVDLTKDKFNIKFVNNLDNLTSTNQVNGYNILINKNAQPLSFVIDKDISVNTGAVLTSKKLSSGYSVIKLTDANFINNFGSISNIAFDITDAKLNENVASANFLNKNSGYIYNVVVYGEYNKQITGTLSGFAYENYGVISQSGVNITYSYKSETDLSEAVSFASMVVNNYDIITNVYATSNILYCSQYTALTSAGIAINNHSNINNVFVAGKISNNKLSETKLIALTNEGIVKNYLVDATSVMGGNLSFEQLKVSGYNIFEEQKYNQNYIWKTNNDNNVYNYEINNGYPYISGGIALSTYTHLNDDVVSYYQTSAQNGYQTIVVNSLYGLKMMSRYIPLNQSSKVNAIFTQDIDVSKFTDLSKTNTKNNIISMGTLTGVVDGNGYTLSNFNISEYLFNTNWGEIKNINIQNFVIDGKDISFVESNMGKIKSINIDYYGAIKPDYLQRFGGISRYNAKNHSIESCTVINVVADVQLLSGGIVSGNYGTIIGCESENITISSKNGSEIGGIAGLSEGIVKDCSVKDANLTADTYVGGIIGKIRPETPSDILDISNNKVNSSTLTAYQYVAGLIGGYFYAYNRVDTLNDIIDEGSVVKNTTIIYDGFATDTNNGWFGSKEEDRFTDVTFGNIEKAVTTGFKQKFKDENVAYDSTVKNWYAPAKSSDSWPEGYSSKMYAKNDGGYDDSTYYTSFGYGYSASNTFNFSSAYDYKTFFSTARGYNENAGVEKPVGLIYGFIPKQSSATYEKTIIKSKDDKNVENNKILLDRFTHWVYVAIEADGNDRGVLVLEFNYYYIPSAYPTKSSFADIMYTIDNSDDIAIVNNLKQYVEINFAYDLYITKTKFGEDGDKKMYAQVTANSGEGIGTYFSVCNGYKGIADLFDINGSDGLIRNFINTVKDRKTDKAMYDLARFTNTVYFSGDWGADVDEINALVNNTIENTEYIKQLIINLDNLGEYVNVKHINTNDYLNEYTSLTTQSVDGVYDGLYFKIEIVDSEYQLTFYKASTEWVAGTPMYRYYAFDGTYKLRENSIFGIDLIDKNGNVCATFVQN